MLHFLKLSFISSIFFVGFSSYAVEVRESSSQIIGVDQILGIQFTLKKVEYDHLHLTLSYLNTNKKFQMVFTSRTLASMPVTDEAFFLQTASNQMLAATVQEKLSLSQLAVKLRSAQNFSYRTDLIQIFTGLVRTASLPKANICEHKGEWLFGSYTANDRQHFVLSPIGDRNSQCYGLCGSKCSNLSRTYSDACLAHDLCHRIEGSQFGSCSDELFDASVSVPTTWFCSN